MKQDHRACRLLPGALGSDAEWQKGGFFGRAASHCWGKSMCRKEEQALTGAVWRLRGLGNPAAGASAEEPRIWASAETGRGQNKLWAWVGKLNLEHCLSQGRHCTNSVLLLSKKVPVCPGKIKVSVHLVGLKDGKWTRFHGSCVQQSLVCERFPL